MALVEDKNIQHGENDAMKYDLFYPDEARKVLLSVKNVNKEVGFGTFAEQDIKQGEIILHFTGMFVVEEEGGDVTELALHVGYTPEGKRVFLVAPEGRMDEDTINHQCFDPDDPPNCWIDIPREITGSGVCQLGQVILRAYRDIKKGEELRFDYAYTEGKMKEKEVIDKCTCGSKTCRQVIRGFEDDNLPDEIKTFMHKLRLLAPHNARLYEEEHQAALPGFIEEKKILFLEIPA